jgi:hypothetical protein
MYSFSLRLSKIRHNKIICLKTKTKSDKSYFDYENKTKQRTSQLVNQEFNPYNFSMLVKVKTN